MIEMKFKSGLSAFLISVITASVGFAQTEKNSCSDAYLKLNEEYKAAMERYSKKLESIDDEKERAAAKTNDPAFDYVPRFAKLMKDHSEDPAALDAAIWVACSNNKSPEVVSEALKLIREKFVTSDKLADVVQTLRRSDSPEAISLLRSVIQKNPSKKLQGLATLMLAQKLANNSSAEAEALFEDLVKNYSNTENIGRQKGTLSEIAGKCLYEIRNLSVGRIAPNISGEDANGKKMSLNDYRGKVVLLTFWGDW